MQMNGDPISSPPADIQSPLREGGVDRVDIVIVDDKDNVVLTTRLLPSLMIRQVKLDIHRMRFSRVSNPTECFSLYYKDTLVNDNVTIRSLSESSTLQFKLVVNKDKMHLEDPKEYGVRRSVPSMGLSPILDRSYAQTLSTAMRPYSQTMTATNRLATQTLSSTNRLATQTLSSTNRLSTQTLSSTNRLATQTLTGSSTVSSDKVKQFVAQHQLEECIAWLQTATLKEEAFQTVVDIARKGFPVDHYGSALFPLLRHYIHALCQQRASACYVSTVMQWYRVVVLDLRLSDVLPVLADVLPVLKHYMQEKAVVQGCVATLLVVSESSFNRKALEVASSVEYTALLNRILSLYAGELWLSSLLQYLHFLATEEGGVAICRVASTEHLRLLAALLESLPTGNVLKSLCSYLEALAASPVPSALFFASPLACRLAGVLRTLKTDGAEMVIFILRVLVELSKRPELRLYVAETGVFATLSAFISAFSTSRTIILLILTLLSNLLRSRDVCLLFYLQNVLYSLQTCQSVWRSDRKLLVLALQCMELVLQQVESVRAEYGENDVETLLHYGTQLMYDGSVIVVICDLLCLMDLSSVLAAVSSTVSRWGEAFKEAEVKAAVQRVLGVVAAMERGECDVVRGVEGGIVVAERDEGIDGDNTAATDRVNLQCTQHSTETDEWDADKDEEIRIPPAAEVEDATPETVMADDRLFLLLLWRLSHSQELLLLEAAADCLGLFFRSGMRGVYMTASGVKFIPALLAKTLSRCQSRALNEACVRVMAFIVETVPEEALLPPHFIPVLSKMMKEYIFLLAVTRGGLSILLAFYDHCGQEAMAYLGTEDTVTALQYIYYATQSQECREKAHTLLTALHAPLQVSADLPLRSDALEDILFAGMVQQLDAKDGKVLLETLEVCREAMTLSQPRFLHAFEAKKGLGKLLGVLRRCTEDEEVKHLALELLRTVVDAKTPSETEAVPLVTTVFRVLQRSEQCRKCAKYLTYLLRRLSVFNYTLQRTATQLPLLLSVFSLHTTYRSRAALLQDPLQAMLSGQLPGVGGETLAPSVTVADNCTYLLKLLLRTREGVAATLRSMGLLELLLRVMKESEGSEVAERCFELFLMLWQPEDSLAVDCDNAMEADNAMDLNADASIDIMDTDASTVSADAEDPTPDFLFRACLRRLQEDGAMADVVLRLLTRLVAGSAKHLTSVLHSALLFRLAVRLHAEEPAHATLAALCGLLTAVAAAPNADVFLHSSGLVPAALQGLGEAIGADDLELVGPMMRCAAAVVSGCPITATQLPQIAREALLCAEFFSSCEEVMEAVSCILSVCKEASCDELGDMGEVGDLGESNKEACESSDLGESNKEACESSNLGESNKEACESSDLGESNKEACESSDLGESNKEACESSEDAAATHDPACLEQLITTLEAATADSEVTTLRHQYWLLLYQNLDRPAFVERALEPYRRLSALREADAEQSEVLLAMVLEAARVPSQGQPCLAVLQQAVTNERACERLVEVGVLPTLISLLSVVASAEQVGLVVDVLLFLTHYQCVIHQFSVDKSLVEQMTRAVSSISKRNIGLRDSFSRLLSYVQSGQMNEDTARKQVLEKYGALPTRNASCEL
ncbi:hypothetical protein AV274_1866 [Blastocystis sp. ATCC 50177/Nand II]|uniref:Uncharacterized protein n=1 Tax=Blastocystis sp. subtype 1 (strain ATCC 50177 / NandII) TaxID=478820 RepID=A0A196SHA5_BLAHN|nr:hypothetical protein AV274_1866 [Blastocystis sp. ATCC 50177/Nand II]